MINYSENAAKQYHTQVGEGDVGRYVLLRGTRSGAQRSRSI